VVAVMFHFGMMTEAPQIPHEFSEGPAPASVVPDGMTEERGGGMVNGGSINQRLFVVSLPLTQVFMYSSLYVTSSLYEVDGEDRKSARPPPLSNPSPSRSCPPFRARGGRGPTSGISSGGACAPTPPAAPWRRGSSATGLSSRPPRTS